MASQNQRRCDSAPLSPPRWRVDDRDEHRVDFRAVPLRMRTLVVLVLAIVLIGGAATTGILIALDGFVTQLGTRFAIVAVGLILGLPASFALFLGIRRRTQECEVTFGRGEVKVRVGDVEHVVAYGELGRFRWRARSDSARVELRGPGIDLSLMTAMAKPTTGHSAELPELPPAVLDRLELEGLVVIRSRRGQVVTVVRS